MTLKELKNPKVLLPFIGISIAALVLRLLWIWQVPTEQLYDFKTYYDIAVNVATGKGYTFLGNPIAFQGMGYSYLLGLYMRAAGSTTELTAKYFNVILSMLMVWSAFIMAFNLSKRPLIYWGTMAFAAFLPHHIAYCNAIGTEVLSATLLSVTLAIQTSTFKARYRWPLLGVMAGAMTLTKPFFLAYPLAIALYEWFTVKNLRQALACFLVAFVCMWVLVAPWTLRNYKYFHRFIPVSYNSGLVLYLNSNASNVHGGYMPLDQIEKSKEMEQKITDELDGGQKSLKLASNMELILKPEATKWIKAHPLEFMKLGFIRVHSTFFNGAWDIDAWTMNGGPKVTKAPVIMSEAQLKAEHAKEVIAQRQVNFFRAINDTSQSILTAMGCLFVLVNLPQFFRALFSKTTKLLAPTALPMLNIAFIVAVCFVYEGQPRYNFPILFLLAFVTMQAVALFVDFGKQQAVLEKRQ